MKKLTSYDRLEALLMDCSPEEFLLLMERVETIKRLRMIQVRSAGVARRNAVARDKRNAAKEESGTLFQEPQS